MQKLTPAERAKREAAYAEYDRKLAARKAASEKRKKNKPKPTATQMKMKESEALRKKYTPSGFQRLINTLSGN